MPFNQDLWNENACACRCLLELASRKQQKVILDVDFYNDNAAGFVEGWTGVTNTYMQCVLAIKLGLANELDTFLDPIRILKEWERKECYGVLVHTERMSDKDDPTTLRDIRHTMLVVGITGNGFRAWNPTKNGNAAEHNYPWFAWYQWMMRATVLYRDP